MWDGEFAGNITFRWQKGTVELPPTVLGHIGYSVIPSRQKRGYATTALAELLLEVKHRGFPYVELVTDIDNLASQKVIFANGGTFVERFRTLPAHGGFEAIRFRITL